MTLAHLGPDPEPGCAAAQAEPRTAHTGARLLVQEVLPLWVRHLAAARDEAERGVNNLLQSFASLGSELSDAIAASESEAGPNGGAAQPVAAHQRLQIASQRLSNEMDLVFAGFQFQDRLNQMLGVLQDDMDRLDRWLQQPESAAPPDVAGWLDRLEQSYTMDEQRAIHHGNAETPPASGVDYF